MNEVYQSLLERFRPKYPDLEARLLKAAERARKAKEYWRQGRLARARGELQEARNFRQLGNDEWSGQLSSAPLSMPSRVYMGQEASCPRCRDVQWLDNGADLFPCPNCEPWDAEAARMKHSGISEVRRLQTLESYKPSVHPTCREALKQARGFCDGGLPWLILSGPAGTGKTHLVRGIAMRLIKEGWVAKYWSSLHFTTLLHSTQAQGSTVNLMDVIEQNANEELLILDDWGVETLSPWVISQYEGLLDRRWDSLMPTIIATNLPASEVRGISHRIHSRMNDVSMSVWVDMMGAKDYRQVMRRSQEFSDELHSAIKGNPRRSFPKPL